MAAYAGINGPLNRSKLLKGDAGIHGPLNRAELLKGDAGIEEVFTGRLRTLVSGSICRNPRTAESVRIFQGDAGIHGPQNRSEFLNRDAGSLDTYFKI